ncbi:MAG: hypothetical protein AB2L24_26600 [Mangrovibacterium sp.]
MVLFQYISLDLEAQYLLDSGLPAQVKRIIADKGEPDEQQFGQFAGCEIAFGNIPATWVAKSSRLKWLQLESCRL